MNGLQTSSTGYTNSLASASLSRRYQGMIKESPLKRIRNLLFNLFDYVSVVAPQMRGLQTFISIWRTIELLGPSLCVGYVEFWGEGSNMLQTMDYISIIFHIFPGVEIRKRVAATFLIIEGFFFLLLLLFVYASAVYYEKNAQLHKYIPASIFFIFSTFGYILPPIGMNLIGELVGYMIQDKNEISFLRIFGIVFALAAFSLYMVIFTLGYSVTVNFRSDSLTTIIPTNQSAITALTLIITFFPACGSKIESTTVTIVMNCCAAIAYLLSIKVFFSKGGFVRLIHLESLVATVIAGTILVLLVAVFKLMKIVANEVVLVVFIVIFIIVFCVTNFLFKIRTKKALITLDNIMDDETEFNKISNPGKFCSIAVNGFRNAHPYCLSFRIFKLAIDKWPKSYDTWLLFAKFSAIYPEETQQLAYIIVGMMQNKMKGAFAKHTMQQIEAVIKQREANLVPELKRKLDVLGRKVSTTKAKIRYIWDLVLQGNIKELEPIIGRAYKSMNANNVDFVHLLSMYPNNRFVARSYARFLRDIVADHQLHAEWSTKVSNLQRGISVSPDNSHDLGLISFPLLPKKLENMQNNMTQNNFATATDDTLTQEIEVDEEKAAIDAEMKLSIKESIDSIVIPSYKNAKIIHFALFFILFLIPFIAISICAPIFIADTTGSLDYLYSLARIRTLLFQGVGLMVHYCGESISVSYPPDDPNFPNKICYPLNNYSYIGDVLDAYEEGGDGWGNTLVTKDQLRFMSMHSAKTLQLIQPMKSFAIGNTAMDKVKNQLFNPSLNFTHYSEPIKHDNWTLESDDPSTLSYNIVVEEMSMVDAISNYLSHYEELLEKDTIETDIFNQRYVITTINNLENISDHLSHIIQLMLTYINSLNKNIQLITLIAMIAIIALILIIYPGVCAYIIISMQRDKMTIYRCLSTLPKNVVSHVAEQFRMLRKDESEEKSSKSNDEELSKQEENLLKLFSTSSDSGENNTLDNFFTVTLTALMVISHIGMCIYLITCFRDAGNQLDQTSPHIDHIYGAYTYELAAIILLHLLPGSVYPKY